MTIATQPDNGVAPAADQSTRGVARIVAWAESAEAAHKLAEILCRTAFCPDQFREQPGQATAAILAGGEVGLSPMASLNAFDIISGRAAPRAITLRAVVLSFGHEVELVESTAARCRMRGRRRGSEAWQTVEWTIGRAQQLGLANKSQWRTQPTAMLVARATSEICRLVAADAILGIGYSAEEIEDMADEQPTKARKVQRQVQPKAAKAPPADTTEDDNELLGGGTAMSTTEEPAKATAAQLRKLGIEWSRLGVTDNLERHTLTGLLVGRDIGGTTKNLTVAEASGLIEKIQDLPDRDALEAALRTLDQPDLQDPPEPWSDADLQGGKT